MTDITELAQLRSELSNPANGSKDHLRKLALLLVEALEKAQQRIDELENDEVRQRLANAEHQLYMAELAKHNLKASRKSQFRKRRAAEKRIAEDVKNSAYTIIEKKHATYYGVAMAVKRICTAVMRDEQTVLPVSSLMVGEYGLSDLAISMPTVVGRDGVVCRVPVPLNDDEQHELTASAKALKDIIDSVDFSC